jgi:hypothetical protein
LVDTPPENPAGEDGLNDPELSDQDGEPVYPVSRFPAASWAEIMTVNEVLIASLCSSGVNRN